MTTLENGSRFASRKFILVTTTILSATGLVAFKLIDGGVYSAVVIAVLGGYFAANVSQKAVEK